MCATLLEATSFPKTCYGRYMSMIDTFRSILIDLFVIDSGPQWI